MFICGQIAERHGARGDRNIRMHGGVTILLEGEGLGPARQNRDRDHHRRATTSPSPYPRIPHRWDFGKTEMMWCVRQDALASNRLSYISASSSASASPTSKENKRLSSASVRTFLGRRDVLGVNADDGAEEAGERLLRASQGVELIAHPKRARSPYVHWVHLPVVRMRGDRPKVQERTEDDDAGARMNADTNPFLNLKLSREDTGLPTSTLRPPTLTSPLRGVEQNTMQCSRSVNVWDTQSSLLRRRHFEINEEHGVQKVEWTASTNRFGGAVYGPTVGDFDCPRPSIDSTLSGAENVMATPTNAAAKFGQKQPVGTITSQPRVQSHPGTWSDPLTMG